MVKILFLKMRKEKLKRKRILLLLMQIDHSNLKFSCGLFEFNWKCIMIVSFFILTFVTIF
jgi:hypothetical protein